MATNTVKCLLIILVVMGSNQAEALADVDPIGIKGVDYRVEHERETPAGPLKAWVKAVDPRSSSVVWRVMLYQGTSRAACWNGVKNPRIASLTSFANGLVAKTDDGACFFIDIDTHKAEIVRDMRIGANVCKLHPRPVEEFLVPIHYGMATGRRLSQDQQKRYPQASLPIEGGCCVMDEKAAIVSRCPDCH